MSRDFPSRSLSRGREYGTITIATPVEINGVRGDVGIAVKNTNKNYYHVHRILATDCLIFDVEKQKTDTVKGEGVTKNGSLAAPDESVYRNSKSQNTVNVKKFSLKGTDSILKQTKG